MYHDIDQLRRIGKKQQARLRAKFGSDFHSFIQPAMNLIDNWATRNIGIFDNLSPIYPKLLRSVGYTVHIFPFKDRKAVSVDELTRFILANDIHTLVVPEIRWRLSVPMLEIVLEKEILNHIDEITLLTRLLKTIPNRSSKAIEKETGLKSTVKRLAFNFLYKGYQLTKPLSFVYFVDYVQYPLLEKTLITCFRSYEKIRRFKPYYWEPLVNIEEILSKELNLKTTQVTAVIRLLDEGDTVPFIARYRKEVTGGVDDTVLRNLENVCNIY